MKIPPLTLAAIALATLLAAAAPHPATAGFCQRLYDGSFICY